MGRPRQPGSAAAAGTYEIEIAAPSPAARRTRSTRCSPARSRASRSIRPRRPHSQHRHRPRRDQRRAARQVTRQSRRLEMPFRLALSGLNAAADRPHGHGEQRRERLHRRLQRLARRVRRPVRHLPAGRSATAIGNGVRVSNVSQQFTQGNIDFTDNSLDLAMSGQGFFILSDSGALSVHACRRLPGRPRRLRRERASSSACRCIRRWRTAVSTPAA